MINKFRLSALAFIIAIFSVQCSQPGDNVPQYPTSIEQHFTPATFSHGGTAIAYQEGEVLSTSSGKTPLVVVLHGQYANGSPGLRAWSIRNLAAPLAIASAFSA